MGYYYILRNIDTGNPLDYVGGDTTFDNAYTYETTKEAYTALSKLGNCYIDKIKENSEK